MLRGEHTWKVEKDVFVPIKTMQQMPPELEEALLQIPGILIGEGEDRLYPFGDKAKETLGYLGGITKEELEARKGDPHYRDTSVIGKAGYEETYDQTLRGMDGGAIFITDTAEGKIVERLLAESQPIPGENVTVNISAAQFQ